MMILLSSEHVGSVLLSSCTLQQTPETQLWRLQGVEFLTRKHILDTSYQCYIVFFHYAISNKVAFSVAKLQKNLRHFNFIDRLN